jgi:ubiquitin-like protein Pup
VPGRIHKERAATRHQDEDATPEECDQAHVARLNEDLDSLLDEIDAVLEENAEEFVSAYIQKGGQ